MVSKAEKVKTAISLGIDFDAAIALFDALEKMELPKAVEAKKSRNKAYYQEHKVELKAKRKKKDVKPLSADLSQIQSIQPVKPSKYLARLGSPEYDAWNAYHHDKFGKSLPHSDKTNGWYVASRWPPNGKGHAP